MFAELLKRSMRQYERSMRYFSTPQQAGDGVEFMRSALHKDSIKIASLLSGGLIIGGVMVIQSGFVSYKVLENAKEMKDLEIRIGEKFDKNAKEMKDLEIRIGEKFEKNTKENAKEMKDLERVIVSQFSNLQTAMISVMASSSNRRPDEIAEKHNNVTSNSNGDIH
jgi:tRNA A37 threonylcarbamoyltransferase TsaD